MEIGGEKKRKVVGNEAAYRRIILALVKALCEIPREPWTAWLHELYAKGIERLDPDEMLVFMVLNNLPTGADLADRKRQEARPQLRAISARRASSRGSSGSGEGHGTSATS